MTPRMTSRSHTCMAVVDPQRPIFASDFRRFPTSIGSSRGAPLTFQSACFRDPSSEPGVRLSSHSALHGFMSMVVSVMRLPTVTESWLGLTIGFCTRVPSRLLDGPEISGSAIQARRCQGRSSSISAHPRLNCPQLFPECCDTLEVKSFSSPPSNTCFMAHDEFE